MSKITANSSSRTGKDHAHQSAAAAAAASSSSSDNDGLKKGPWTAEEDQKLVDYIEKHGYGRWRTLPKNAGLKRCGKSCRLRWTNYLRPDIKRGRFSNEEEETIIQLHSILGNKWSAIAARLPGRTDNEIKNYWNTHIKKRLLRMGVDPMTHAPQLDLLHLSSILSSSLHNYTHLSNSLGVMGSMASDQNKDLLDLAKQLMVISQSIPQGTPANSLESLLANQLQTLNHIQVQGQDSSPNLGYVGRPYHTLPISSWETNHGGFGQTLNSLGAEGSVHLGHSTNEYLDSVHFDPSIITNPNNELRYNNVKEVVQNSGASPVLSSPMSNSGCTFNSSSSTIMRYGTSGAFNVEDERETAYRSSVGIMYDDIINVSSVNSFM